jgi:glycosyltransferase involved in cell wall biosynthesis
MTNAKRLALDIIVPLYNEEKGVKSFHLRLTRVTACLAVDTTIYYVDDGSTDETGAILGKIAEEDPSVVVVELSRNFGHQAALSAGLDIAKGDVVVTMDGDGQHPPDLLPDMLKLFQGGYDVVLTQRSPTQEAGFLKRFASEGFYWFLSRISDTRVLPGCADYRLMSRPVVDALKGMREYHRFLRGMVAWLGYRTVILPYSEELRIAGRSKYSLRKMVKLATDAISSFSLVPLRIGIGLGVCFLVLAALEVGYVLLFWLRGQRHLLVPGWSSLMFAILLVGGIGMVGMGVIGTYIGYIFQEVKRRPVYVVRSLRRPGSAGQGGPGIDGNGPVEAGD